MLTLDLCHHFSCQKLVIEVIVILVVKDLVLGLAMSCDLLHRFEVCFWVALVPDEGSTDPIVHADDNFLLADV